MRWKRMTIGVVVACLAIAPAAQAAQFTVTGTADVAGSCTGTECTSIRAALGAISGGDQITLQPGAYQLASALVLNTPVALRGDTARNTTITAASGARALLISANATISHLTVTDGTAPNGYGGNILAQSVTVGLDQVRVTNGRAGTGGGIANRNGTMTITNSLIDGNSAEFTGGKGDLLEAAAGGIVNSGDAIGPASLTLTNSTVSRNAAVRGGGIVSYGSAGNALALENVTVAGNRAGAGGSGGILAQLGTFSLGSSILAGNTLLADGSTSNCGGDRASSQGWNIETGDQCLNREEPDRINVADAGLPVSPTNGGGETDVLAPDLGSPAVNVKSGTCQPADQRGVVRPQGPACDSGAVELAYPVRIDSGPSGTTRETDVQFTFSSSSANSSFQCALDTPSVPTGSFAECPSTHSINDLTSGEYTLHVRAMVDDKQIGETQRTFTVAAGGGGDPIVINSGPNGPIKGPAATFDFTASGASECRLFTPQVSDPAYVPCTSPHTFNDLTTEGAYTFEVTPATTHDPGLTATRAFSIDTTAPDPPGITSPDENAVLDSSFVVAGTMPSDTTTINLFDNGKDIGTASVLTGSWSREFGDVPDGTHVFTASATDAAGNTSAPSARRTVVVDRAAPGAVVPTQPEPTTFTFASAENGGSFECRLEGPSGDSGFGPCTSPRAYPDLPAGDYRFTLRTLDAAGNHADAPATTFSIAAMPTAIPTATPATAPVVVPVAPPSPTPQAGKTVVARPSSGKILVRQPGSTQFVEISRSSGVPLGSEIDARKGRVVLTSEPGDGKPVERATFYAGLFIVRQVGGYVELTLSEELAPCKKKKASAAAAKPKSRKLWGDGKGKFRTKGSYSAATIRGTKWLVEDSCDGTLTRVAQGVVSVRDTPKRKTVLLRAGRKYLAKPPKK